jgi:hypothetical protein
VGRITPVKAGGNPPLFGGLRPPYACCTGRRGLADAGHVKSPPPLQAHQGEGVCRADERNVIRHHTEDFARPTLAEGAARAPVAPSGRVLPLPLYDKGNQCDDESKRCKQ